MDISVKNYYYDEQLRKAIIQFMAIFAGIKVAHGKREDQNNKFQEVPIAYGSRDRVVSHIFSENTQNKMLSLPTMAAQLINLEMAADMFKGMGEVRKETKLRYGGTIPDDVEVIETLQSVPYRATMELSILCSNTSQHFQILEQILLLFNPSLQIQVSDSYGSRQKIMTVFLESVLLGENYPPDADRRIIETNLTFTYVLYLTPPSNITKDIVKEISVRVSQIENGEQTDVEPFIIDLDGAPQR